MSADFRWPIHPSTLLGAIVLGSSFATPAVAQRDAVIVLSGSIFGPSGPVVGASVAVAGTAASATADARGSFMLTALMGRRFLHVRAVGFEPYDTLLNVVDAPISLTIRMRRAAVQLDSVRVTASGTAKPARYSQTSKFDVFYERKAAAIGGTFLTREDIEHNGSSEAIDLFRSVPGIEIAARPGMAPLIRFARCTGSKASPFGSIGKLETMGKDGYERPGPVEVFIDGSRVGEPLSTLERMRTDDIEAIEIYRGVSQLPIEARGNGCAAVFIWTRYSTGSVLDKKP